MRIRPFKWSGEDVSVQEDRLKNTERKKFFWEKHELFANSCHWKMIEQLAKY